MDHIERKNRHIDKSPHMLLWVSIWYAMYIGVVWFMPCRHTLGLASILALSARNQTPRGAYWFMQVCLKAKQISPMSEGRRKKCCSVAGLGDDKSNSG